MQEEYEELLKYAVVVPTYDPRQMAQSFAQTRQTYPRPHPTSTQQADHEDNGNETDRTVTDEGGRKLYLLST